MSDFPPNQMPSDPFIREPRQSSPHSAPFSAETNPVRTKSDYAGWWIRVAAKLLDILIISLVTGIILAISFFGLLSADYIALSETSTATGEVTEEDIVINNEGLVVAVLVGSVILPYLLYETTMVALRGQTVGKMATRITIINTDTEDIPGWGKSFLRFLVPTVLTTLGAATGSVMALLTTLAWWIMYLWITWDSRKQGLHDKIVGTVVIKNR